MTAIRKIEKGDYDLRGNDADQVFARKSWHDSALTAATWRCPETPGFPGLALYLRIVAGNGLNDAQLFAWARSLAWGLAKSKRKSGQPFIAKRGEWIDWAGTDALWYAINKRWPESAESRASQLDISHVTFRKLRDPIAGGMLVGLDNFVSDLHRQYRSVKNYDAQLIHSFHSAFLKNQ